MKIQIRDNIYFAYIRDLEYIATLAGMLAENLDGRMTREIYGEEYIKEFRRTHMEANELINSVWFGGMEIAEFLMDYKCEKFVLKEYFEYIKNLPVEQFIYQLFGYYASLEEVREALKDENKLIKLYEEEKFKITSYLNLKLIIRDKNLLLDKFYECIQEIRTPELEKYLDEFESKLPELQLDIEARSIGKNPNEIVEEIVKKKYLSQREYKAYAFLPVCMLPRNAAQYVKDSQFVVYSQSKISSREKAINILKVISDDTRIRIIDRLTEKKRINGKEISHFLQLAPSTVSYHMDQMVACGIVKEEKCGNAKFYTIDRENGTNLLRELEGIIMKNTDY